MRFRATLASLLTVMLLSLAPFASGCEIKCDMASMGNGCRGSSVSAHGNQTMAGMAGMEQKISPEPGDQDQSLVAAAPACHTHVCAQQPAVFSEQRSVVAHVSMTVEAVCLQMFQVASEPEAPVISPWDHPHSDQPSPFPFTPHS